MTHLIVPHFGLGLGVGAIDAALMPLLATIVDQRYPGLYGACYAVSQTTVCLAYFLGPLLGASLIAAIGFPALIRLIGIANIIQAPFDVRLRNADIDLGERMPLVTDSTDLTEATESPAESVNANGTGNFYSYGTTQGSGGLQQNFY
jgi:MFS family permease